MKLKDIFETKKDITIAYLGGSITENSGYRNIFTDYLKETYPDNNITEINAGIGGTNSFLGVARAQKDVISKSPDIVVVDFSVNDNHSGEYNPFFGRSYEGIMRKLLAYNPNLPIIAIGFTTDAMNREFYDNGTYPFSVKIHRFLCEEYKIPYINVGELLYKHIKETNETMMDYTVDNVHPDEKGSKFYGEAFINAIKDYDFSKAVTEKILFKNVLENCILSVPNIADGWKKGQWNKRRIEDYIYSDTPGTELETEFSGTALGLFTIIEKASGNILYSIDGGDWKEKQIWDTWALSFDRLAAIRLEESLNPGNHTLKIKISENKAEESEGHSVKIIALLAEKPE